MDIVGHGARVRSAAYGHDARLLDPRVLRAAQNFAALLLQNAENRARPAHDDVGGRRLVSAEAAADWRREREASPA